MSMYPVVTVVLRIYFDLSFEWPDWGRRKLGVQVCGSVGIVITPTPTTPHHAVIHSLNFDHCGVKSSFSLRLLLLGAFEVTGCT
jgi:hypothetical protein